VNRATCVEPVEVCRRKPRAKNRKAQVLSANG
jgi:hypothetical protein